MYTEVMADIESLGTKHNAVVLSIGAVKFNLQDEDNYDTLELPDRTFHEVLEIKSQVSQGRHIDPDTIKWWMQQSIQARKLFEHKNPMFPSEAMKRFHMFCSDTDRLWGNGSTFDNVILRSLADSYGEPFPYPFWADVDLRTLAFLGGGKEVCADIPRGVAHDALDDAKFQVLCAQEYYRRMRG